MEASEGSSNTPEEKREFRYNGLNRFLRETFGQKVFKVGLVGGFTCPNRDGTLGTAGCSFCNPDSSKPLNHAPGMSIGKQLASGTAYIQRRHRANAFLAYFQDRTTTYGDPRALEALYNETLAFPGVVGLCLCTRPDCLSEPVLSLLEGLSKNHFIWVELGVQSGSESTLERMSRRHTVAQTEQAFKKLHSRGIRTSGHVILGYPGETHSEAMATAELLNRAGTAGVKIQNLHVVRNTELERQYATDRFSLPDRREYAALAVDFLERLRPAIVIQRLTGEAPAHLTVAPEWSVNKLGVLGEIRAELTRRNTFQGRLYGEGG